MEQITAEKNRTIQLGYAGENRVRQILFPLDRFRVLGEGRGVLVAELPGDDRLYPIPLEQREDAAVWTVTAAETVRHGGGQVQFHYLVGDKIAKTEVYSTWVMPSMEEPDQTKPPEAQQSWMDQVLAAGQSTAASAERAARSAGEAEQAVTQAAGHVSAARDQADRAAQEADRAGEAARALIDDRVLSTDKVLSGKRTADLLGDPFAVSGPVVTCQPLEGYPLEVVSGIALRQEGTGEPGPDNVRQLRAHTGAVLMQGGKNLISTADLSYEENCGIDVVPRKDGGVELNGTARKKLSVILHEEAGDREKPAGEYILSGAPEGCKYGTMWMEIEYVRRNGDRAWRADTGRTVEVPELASVRTVYIVIAAGTQVDHMVFRPQLEMGNRATAYEPFRSREFTVQFGREVYQGSYSWNTGLLTVLSRKFSLRVADMNHTEEGLSGWRDVPGLSDVVGREAEHAVIGTADVCRRVRVDARRSAILLEQAGMTQDQWKERWPDLTVNLLVPYREDLRPVIRLAPQIIPGQTGENLLYADTGDAAVRGIGRPTAALAERMEAVERMVLELRAGCV